MEFFIVHMLASIVVYGALLACLFGFSLIFSPSSDAGHLQPKLSNSLVRFCQLISILIVVFYLCVYPHSDHRDQRDALTIITIANIGLYALMAKVGTNKPAREPD